MPFLIQATITLAVFLLLSRRNFSHLWKGGLIGVGIMLTADTIGHYLNLYHYQNGLIMIGGYMPSLHVFNIFLTSVLYLNWLPAQWPKKIQYTVYFSVLALAVEGIMFQAGAIVYPHWNLAYSYLLLNFGLNLLSYFWDLTTATGDVSACRT